MVGMALGPVFSTCSPTYFVILASVLPASFALGTIYMLSYVLGLTLVLLAIGLLGNHLSKRLSAYSDPHSWFKRTLGVFFMVLGVMVAFGFEKKFESAILDLGYFDVGRIEHMLLESLE